jgi:hypothetical protein
VVREVVRQQHLAVQAQAAALLLGRGPSRGPLDQTTPSDKALHSILFYCIQVAWLKNI